MGVFNHRIYIVAGEIVSTSPGTIPAMTPTIHAIIPTVNPVIPTGKKSFLILKSVT
jgi:hypothetical protein